MTELFENFEVNRESRMAVLLRLIGASLAVHLVLMWMVIYVPAVRDTVNIAALIATTRWVDEDYTATRIGDEVQIVPNAGGCVVFVNPPQPPALGTRFKSFNSRSFAIPTAI